MGSLTHVTHALTASTNTIHLHPLKPAFTCDLTTGYEARSATLAPSFPSESHNQTSFIYIYDGTTKVSTTTTTYRACTCSRASGKSSSRSPTRSRACIKLRHHQLHREEHSVSSSRAQARRSFQLGAVLA